ncbi:hypothetical protein [Curtobacterium sp. NPDC089185]|uniref:hypothetical protein n=1 Tax=Curtobacterium sp. NPDC089185 TaxID=3154968 RepID=UPI003424E7DD
MPTTQEHRLVLTWRFNETGVLPEVVGRNDVAVERVEKFPVFEAFVLLEEAVARAAECPVDELRELLPGAAATASDTAAPEPLEGLWRGSSQRQRVGPVGPDEQADVEDVAVNQLGVCRASADAVLVPDVIDDA